MLNQVEQQCCAWLAHKPVDEDSAQQIFQRAPVNVFQWFDLSHGDVLIDFMNARVRGATFDNLRADLCDETTVRGATGR